MMRSRSRPRVPPSTTGDAVCTTYWQPVMAASKLPGASRSACVHVHVMMMLTASGW